MANKKVQFKYAYLLVLVLSVPLRQFASVVTAFLHSGTVGNHKHSSSFEHANYLHGKRRYTVPSAFPLQSSLQQQKATNRGLDRDDDKASFEEYSYIEQSLKSHPLQTPHSGRHFLPSHPAYRRKQRGIINLRHFLWNARRRKRFTEGWYYRLTLTNATAITSNGTATQGSRTSFAFIISIEDPGLYPRQSDLRLSCIQVVGPNDGYLVQADQDDTKFWAWKKRQALGCTFEYINDKITKNDDTVTAVTKEAWKETVKSGFQIMLPDHLIGRVDGHDGTLGGVLPGQGVPGYCEFDIAIDEVLCGWGSGNTGVSADDDHKDGTIRTRATTKQKSTAGWLSKFDIFEPHWQVTMADARASGTVIWNNTTYKFRNEPFYAEKNWGAALPSKWYWTQCNSFDGYEQLSVTAGGGIRKVPFGQQESLGMVSVHYNGIFYEAVPWTGSMSWNVSTWGYWQLTGTCTMGSNPFEVQVMYQCDPEKIPGLKFRAPTPDSGMVYFCRDTFDATTSLTLWELEFDPISKTYKRKLGPPLINNATSTQGGAEIGGGPWWDSWISTSKLKRTISTLLMIPYQLRTVKEKVIGFQKRKQ